MTTQDDKLSAEERAAVKQRAAEVRKQASRKGGSKKEKDRQDVVDTIAGLTGSDQAIAQMLDEVVDEVAPDLDSKTYYGFPAYAARRQDRRVLPAGVQVQDPLRNARVRRGGEPR